MFFSNQIFQVQQPSKLSKIYDKSSSVTVVYQDHIGVCYSEEILVYVHLYLLATCTSLFLSGWQG